MKKSVINDKIHLIENFVFDLFLTQNISLKTSQLFYKRVDIFGSFRNEKLEMRVWTGPTEGLVPVVLGK